MPHPVKDWWFIARETLAISIPTVVDALRGRVTVQACDERLERWSRRLVDETGAVVKVHGTVDWSQPYVVMSNHQSHLDIPVLFQVVHGTMRMVTKTELFKVPIWGRAMRDAGFVEIDRGNHERAIASLKVAKQKISGGTHIWIAPEGTRSRTGALGPLKKGGFRLALDTGAPILPIALCGTIDVIRPHGFTVHRDKPVDVWIGEPIPVAGETVDSLMGKVQAYLERYLPTIRKPGVREAAPAPAPAARIVR